VRLGFFCTVSLNSIVGTDIARDILCHRASGRRGNGSPKQNGRLVKTPQQKLTTLSSAEATFLGIGVTAPLTWDSREIFACSSHRGKSFPVRCPEISSYESLVILGRKCGDKIVKWGFIKRARPDLPCSSRILPRIFPDKVIAPKILLLHRF
jgi:hypothetical protein